MTTWTNKGAQQRGWPWPRPQRCCSSAVVAAAANNSNSSNSSSRRASAVERMAAQIEQQYPDVRHVRPEEVIRSQLQQDQQLAAVPPLQLVDVRPGAERAVSMLPGAISLAELERRLQKAEQRQDHQQLYVLYCTIGKRSSDAARRLQARHGDRGPSFANLRGSMLAWAHAGLPLEGDDPKRAHCYARPWALLPDGYECVVYAPAQLLLQAVLPPNEDA